MFRDLNEQEQQEYRKWARDNFDPSRDKINSVWHPVVRDECDKIIAEQFMVENFGEDGLQ